MISISSQKISKVMVLTKDAFRRTFRDLSHLGHRLMINHFEVDGEQNFLRIIIGVVAVCLLLLLGASISPYINQQISSDTRDTVYLNIMEPLALGKSSLCTFQAKGEGNLILNTSLSADERIVFISFPDRVLKKLKCITYESNLPFHKADTEGTIINVFTGEGHEFFANNTAKDEGGILVKSRTPLRVFVRNKDAVLAHFTNLTASLVRSVVHFNSQVEKIGSRAPKFLAFAGEFVFSNNLDPEAIASLKKPKVFLYLTPELDEVDFTALSTFHEGASLKVNFGFKDHGEQLAFVKISAILNPTSAESAHSKGLVISKVELVDPKNVNQYRAYPKTIYYLIMSFLASLTGLFVFNLSNPRSYRGKTEAIKPPEQLTSQLVSELNRR